MIPKNKKGPFLQAILILMSLLAASLNQGCSPDPEAEARDMFIRAQVKWQQAKKNEAKETLQKIIAKFPQTETAGKAKATLSNFYKLEADTLLKDALMYKRLRKKEVSKDVLEKIIREYPDSISAVKARNLIERVDADDESDLFFDLEYKRYAVKEVSGSFVKTESGRIYIIRGKVIHNFTENRSAILLKGSLLDGEDRVIQQRFNYAGNILTEESIRNMNREELHEALDNLFRKNIIHSEIRPYMPVPFMIIFDVLPEKWKGFRVIGIHSSPGRKMEHLD